LASAPALDVYKRLVWKRCKIEPAVVCAGFLATVIDGTGLIIYFKIAEYTLGLE
ncbi:hypothetical protein ACVGXH_25080, partial [Enterobacter intestinihominis]